MWLARPGGPRSTVTGPSSRIQRAAARSRPEVEREAVEHLPPGRQAAQRRLVAGVEPGGDLTLCRVPGGSQVDRSGEGAGTPHQVRSGWGRRTLY